MDAAQLIELGGVPSSSRRLPQIHHIIAQAAKGENDFADFAETAGSGFAFTLSSRQSLLNEERPLGMFLRPERPFQNIPGSLGGAQTWHAVSASSGSSAQSLSPLGRLRDAAWPMPLVRRSISGNRPIYIEEDPDFLRPTAP